MRLATLLLLIVSTGFGEAATILERRVELSISGPTLRERNLLVVMLDEVGDLDAWNRYTVFVDDDIKLEEVSIEVFDANDKRLVSVPRRKLREETSVGFGLYSSGRALVAELPALAIGQRLRFEVVRLHTPIYPTHRVPVLLDTAQKSLQIIVHDGGARLRSKLHDPNRLLEEQSLPGGLRVVGADLPTRVPPNHAGHALSVAPALRIAWGEIDEWSELGAWYTGLTSGVERQSDEVQRLAANLSRELSTKRDKLIALADYARRNVRYEAVEVGVGGWIPSPAHEVIKRGWGDCKDKSELLAELLRAIGIESHLVLLHSGLSGELDPRFATTLGINHCVLAVPGAELDLEANDATVDGLLILDPTLDRGHALWPSPYLQGQLALVAAADKSRLVRLPLCFETEGRRFEASGTVSPSGDLSADVRLLVSGSRALSWIRDMETLLPERLSENVHQLMQSLVSGADVQHPGIRNLNHPIPTVLIEARVWVDGFARGSSTKRILPDMLSALPEPRDLESRTEPCVLRPGVHSSTWKLRLPVDWCLPESTGRKVSNGVGELSVAVGSSQDDTLLITRYVEVRERWIKGDMIEQLAELAISESKENRRSLRWRCPDDN